MADEQLLHKIHGLGDLDLAALLCLVSREHCIISTEPDELDALTEELRLVASQTFNLQSAVVDCTPHTTLDDLAASILQQQQPVPQTPKPPSQSLSPGGLAAATPRSSSSASPLRRRGGTTEPSSYFHHARHGSHGGNGGSFTPTLGLGTGTGTGTSSQQQPRIANVVLARNLDRAPRDVQIQCLELLRTRRILTRTSVQTAPKQFLFVAVLEESAAAAAAGSGGGGGSNGGNGLVSHLNDFFYVSHWHDPEDGFVHLEEEQEEHEEDSIYEYGRGGGETASLDSASSVVRRSIVEMPSPRTDRGRSVRNMPGDEFTNGSSSSSSISSTTTTPISISESDIASLARLTCQVGVDIEVLRYQMNIVSFLRLHRAVCPGGGTITPLATKHFGQLARCLAAVHGLDYVTPSLVALAAKKVYPHRIRIATPERERSVQWGSDLAAVEAVLEGAGPEDVIEDVLAEVVAPL
ncbi:hypothetical protein Hte_007120 [Hypoxylon texense]